MLIRCFDIISLFTMGILLGVAGDALLQLLDAEAWAYISILLVLAVFYILLIHADDKLDKLFDVIFPSWKVKIISTSKVKRRKLIRNMLSILIGCLLGLALAHFRFVNTILKFFSF